MPLPGAHAAQVLGQTLPPGYRVVLIERNSHMNNLYVLPRFAVLPGHEYKAFIPLNKLLPSAPSSSTSSPASSSSTFSASPSPDDPHVLIHAEVASITPHSVTLSRPHPALKSLASTSSTSSDDGKTLHFDYLIYALGSHLPAPINLWASVPDDDGVPVSGAEDCEKDDANEAVMVVPGSKEAGIAWLRRFQRRVARAQSVLVVGGGALGIRTCLPFHSTARSFAG